jgi:hypothetical protein
MFGGMRNVKLWSNNLKERDNFGDPCVAEGMILKLILDMTWAGLSWPRVGSCGGLLYML